MRTEISRIISSSLSPPTDHASSFTTHVTLINSAPFCALKQHSHSHVHSHISFAQNRLLLPGVRAFLDVDDLEDNLQLERHVEQSQAVLIFLSKGYFFSKNCLRELDCAVALDKPLILVHEADLSHGGAPLEHLRDECLSKKRFELFEKTLIFEDEAPVNGVEQRSVITWHRTAEFQLVTMEKICAELLHAAPGFDQVPIPPDVYVPGEASRMIFAFENHVLLHVSPYNPGAWRLALELEEHCDGWKKQLMRTRKPKTLDIIEGQRAFSSSSPPPSPPSPLSPPEPAHEAEALSEVALAAAQKPMTEDAISTRGVEIDFSEAQQSVTDPGSVAAQCVDVKKESAQLVTISTGPLGMTLSNSLDGSAVAVTSVVVGSAAEAQGVRVGAFVLEVNGETTTALDKDAVVALIIAASRPLTLKLRPSSEKSRSQTPVQSTELLVSIEAGPLGIHFVAAAATDLWDSRESFVVVSSVDDDSDAENQGVRVGYVLLEINGEPLAGMDVAAVMKIIKAARRPLVLKLRSSTNESRSQTPAGPGSSNTQSELLVSFEAGPLGMGIANATIAERPMVVVSSVGTSSAAASKGVRVGCVLQEANGESLAGMDKAGVMAIIKTASRPLTLKLTSSAAESHREPGTSPVKVDVEEAQDLVDASTMRMEEEIELELKQMRGKRFNLSQSSIARGVQMTHQYTDGSKKAVQSGLTV